MSQVKLSPECREAFEKFLSEKYTPPFKSYPVVLEIEIWQAGWNAATERAIKSANKFDRAGANSNLWLRGALKRAIYSQFQKLE